jgi:hypothetical protein
VQVEHRRTRGAEREPGGDPLDTARDEQPGDRVGEHEQHRRAEQRAQGDEQHRAPADLVGDTPGQKQRGKYADGVDREHEREDERREAPFLAVDAVQRRGRGRREQREPDHARHERVGEPRREGARSPHLLDGSRDGHGRASSSHISKIMEG